MKGKGLSTGADILVKIALADKFPNASRQYVDNGSERLANPYIDAMNQNKVADVAEMIEEIVIEEIVTAYA